MLIGMKDIRLEILKHFKLDVYEMKIIMCNFLNHPILNFCYWPYL